MDLKSYEIVQNMISLEALNYFILNNVNISNPQPISIKEHLFEVEFHPQNDYLSFTYTIGSMHDIYHKECRFRNSIYLYSPAALAEYEEDFSGVTLLLFTRKKFLYVIPKGENDLSKMEWASGKLMRIL